MTFGVFQARRLTFGEPHKSVPLKPLVSHKTESVSYKSVVQCPTRVSPRRVSKECPAKLSYKRAPHEFPMRVSPHESTTKIARESESTPRECSTRATPTQLNIPQERVSNKSLARCPTRVSRKGVPQKHPTVPQEFAASVSYRVANKSDARERPPRVCHQSRRSVPRSSVRQEGIFHERPTRVSVSRKIASHMIVPPE